MPTTARIVMALDRVGRAGVGNHRRKRVAACRRRGRFERTSCPRGLPSVVPKRRCCLANRLCLAANSCLRRSIGLSNEPIPSRERPAARIGRLSVTAPCPQRNDDPFLHRLLGKYQSCQGGVELGNNQTGLPADDAGKGCSLRRGLPMRGVERGVHTTRLWSTIGRTSTATPRYCSDGHSLTMAIAASRSGTSMMLNPVSFA